MAAVSLHTLDMLSGVKMLVEYCLQKKLKRKSEKYRTFFYVRQWIEIVYVKVL